MQQLGPSGSPPPPNSRCFTPGATPPSKVLSSKAHQLSMCLSSMSSYSHVPSVKCVPFLHHVCDLNSSISLWIYFAAVTSEMTVKANLFVVLLRAHVRRLDCRRQLWSVGLRLKITRNRWPKPLSPLLSQPHWKTGSSRNVMEATDNIFTKWALRWVRIFYDGNLNIRESSSAA